MSWSDIAIPFIQGFESCSLTAYHGAADRPGLWSIGWGSTGTDIVEGLVWTQDQCDQRLQIDIQNFGDHVDNLVTVSINDNQKAALVSFVYNLGVYALQNSTLLRLLNEGSYDGAAGQFQNWDHANGVEVAGLKRRRLTEQQLFNTEVADVDPNALSTA